MDGGNVGDGGGWRQRDKEGEKESYKLGHLCLTLKKGETKCSQTFGIPQGNCAN